MQEETPRLVPTLQCPSIYYALYASQISLPVGRLCNSGLCPKTKQLTSSTATNLQSFGAGTHVLATATYELKKVLTKSLDVSPSDCDPPIGPSYAGLFFLA